MIKERERLLEKDPNYPLPNDAITWVMNMSATDHSRPTYSQQAELQLLLSMASIHASRTTLTNVLYDLLSRPEYLAPLHAEIDSLCNPTTVIDKTMPARLILLDSLLKESQRLTSVGQLTFDRRITSRKGLTLSNGLHLRKETHVGGSRPPNLPRPLDLRPLRLPLQRLPLLRPA
jgi:cytochrome P450